MTDVSRPLQYVEMEAAPALSDVVMSYWSFQVHALPTPDFVHRVWPDGCASMALGYQHNQCFIAVIVGPSVVAGVVPVEAGQRYWGIRFRPEAGAALCRRDASTLRDSRVYAADVFGNAIDPLLQQLQMVTAPNEAAHVMDAWLLQHRSTAHSVDALVRNAVQHIVRAEGTCRIQDVATSVHLTLRQLQRRFRAATGLTPKEYANIRRARSALKRVLSGESTRALGGWARVAAASGYADQAHLARECTRLLQLTPTMLSARLGDITHDRIVD